MPAITKTQLTGGSFQDSEGNLLSGGYLTFVLNQDGVVNTSQVCAGIKVTVNLDGYGTAIAGQYVWANDVLSPVNSYYTVTGYKANGQIAWGNNNQQVTSGGAGGGTFDLGSWIPNLVTSWTPAPQPLSLKTNGTLNGNQFLLNLNQGSNITLTDNGSGQVTIAGSAAIALQTNNTPNASQVLLNLFSGTNITVADAGAGKVTITNTMPRSSTISFAVPLWTNASGNWKESPAGAWTIGQASQGASTQTFVQPTSTVPGYVLFQQIGANNNSNAEFIGSVKGQYLGQTKVFQINAAVFATTNLRYWIGLTSLTTVNSSQMESANPTAAIVGFRRMAGTDTNWTAYVSTDNVNFSTHDTGVSVDTTGAMHVFEFRTVQGTPGTINFYIDGVACGSLSTNVPTATTALTPLVYVESLFTTTTTAIGCNLIYSEIFQ